MKLAPVLVCLAVGSILAGCTNSPVPPLARKPDADTAHLSWQHGSGLKIYLAALDGVPIEPVFRGGPRGHLSLPPGTHEVVVLVVAGRLGSRVPLTLDAEGGQSYVVEAEADGLHMNVAIRVVSDKGAPRYAVAPTRVATSSTFAEAWTDIKGQ